MDCLVQRWWGLIELCAVLVEWIVSTVEVALIALAASVEQVAMTGSVVHLQSSFVQMSAALTAIPAESVGNAVAVLEQRSVESHAVTALQVVGMAGQSFAPCWPVWIPSADSPPPVEAVQWQLVAPDAAQA